MLYVAKIHVIDVLDQVVVSGYVIDTQQEPGSREHCLEFTWQVSGKGVDEPVAWLADALSRALPQASPAMGRTA